MGQRRSLTLLAANTNPGYRSSHRIRSRRASQRVPEWEFFQALLGYAFTLQREFDRQICDPVAAEREQGLHPMLQRVVACAQNLTEASGAAIALGTSEAMICVARSGASAPPEGTHLDARSGLSGECIRTGESTICVNASADPRVNYQACRALDVASMLYFPLRATDGKIMGVLGVFSSRPRHFSQKDISCLRFVEGMVQDALAQNAGDLLNTPFASLLRQGDVPEATVEVAEALAIETAAPTLPATAPVQKAAPEPAVEAKPAAVSQARPAYEVHVVKPEPKSVAKSEVKTEAIFVGRVVDESVRDINLDVPNLDLATSMAQPRSRIPAVLALVIVASIAFASWHYRSLIRRTEPVPQANAASVESAPVLPAAVPPADTAAADKIITSEVSLRSQDASATITILLPHWINAEGYELTNPDRIYFDLHDVKLTDAKGKIFKSDEGLISRVRLAQSSPSVTRVVFDLRAPASWESRQEHNPERLVIEMKRTGPVSQEVPTPSGPTKVTIVIDPGHGGRDLGTTSPSGLKEKDLSLDVALRLGKLLQDQIGAHVVYTRSKDEYVSLDDRADVANRTQADFLISIHGNSSSLPSVRGVETYYFQVPDATVKSVSSSAARALAADIHRGLVTGLGAPHDRMRDRGVRPANFVVLRQAQMPAVLAEISYLSSQKDEPRLETESYREQIAQSLYNGIVKHLSRTVSKTKTLATLTPQHWTGTP